MSKFTDKLARLHASRVRALEADDGSERARVFVAEDDDVATGPSAAPTAAPAPVADSPARRAVREQLQIGERLEARSGHSSRDRPPRVKMQRATESAPPRRAPAAAPRSDGDNAIGERLAELRQRAEALIAVGGLESALPILHEMAALSPTHPFALTQLAAHWRDAGHTRLAEHYAQRLAAVAPY